MSTFFIAIHYLSFALALAALTVQSIFLRRPQDFPGIRVQLLARIDALYGLSAVGSVVTGLLRVFLYGKGVSYYGTHTLFWVKMAVFAVVGLLSIFPTVQFLRNRELALLDWAVNRPEMLKRLHRIVALEMILFVILPFLATQIARGPHF